MPSHSRETLFHVAMRSSLHLTYLIISDCIEIGIDRLCTMRHTRIVELFITICDASYLLVRVCNFAKSDTPGDTLYPCCGIINVVIFFFSHLFILFLFSRYRSTKMLILTQSIKPTMIEIVISRSMKFCLSRKKKLAIFVFLFFLNVLSI